MGKSEQQKPEPAEWTAPDGSRWSITIEWAEIGGRAECVGVALRSLDAMPRPVTSVLWRSVPIASLIDEDRARQADMFARERHLFTQGRRVVGADGTPLPPAEALSEVAAIYKAAWQSSDQHGSPTQAVADALGMSRSAAAKRVRRARDAGLLPETSKGRANAGEAT